MLEPYEVTSLFARFHIIDLDFIWDRPFVQRARHGYLELLLKLWIRQNPKSRQATIAFDDGIRWLFHDERFKIEPPRVTD